MVKYLLLCCTLLIFTQLFAQIEVKVPLKTSYSEGNRYPLDLLRFILDKSGEEYVIIFSTSDTTTQSRDVVRIKNNDGINLGWYGTSKQLETDLVPIRYPIWRGLLGYRVFIIHKDKQKKFGRHTTLAELQQMVGLQGFGWSDIEILEHSGLTQQASKYDRIFAQINAGRSDYFSRGITQVFPELEARKSRYPNLRLEKNVLLIYPFAGFFFTNKENLKIARALEKGFERAYRDGSFHNFFYKHPAVKHIFEKVELDKRIKIYIPNPLLSKETAAIPAKYWHSVK